MRWFRRILFIVLAGGFFYGAMRFASQNANPVVVDYLAGQTAELELWKALAHLPRQEMDSYPSESAFEYCFGQGFCRWFFW